MKTKHLPLVQDSGNQEYYTDKNILALVHEVMGSVDLDPASNSLANCTVQATTFFCKEDNGLAHDWHGRVWMNHPFDKGEKACGRYKSTNKDHKKGDYNCKKRTCNDPKYRHYRGHHIDVDIPSNYDWISYLQKQYEGGNVTEAINISFAELSSNWGQIMTGGVHCIPSERINYYKLDPERPGEIVKDNGVPKGSIIRYWGKNPEAFARVFSRIGTVNQPFPLPKD
ncbi:hypothetical protein [Aliivibrio salmonicida]|uniref:hypothetical protein n=1 Tax=Aliivibrio salmonicida TaxID=40269 RepID=UPI003D10C204